MYTIQQLFIEDKASAQPDLAEILQGVVNDGATVSFLPPLSMAEANAYWETVWPHVADGSWILWGARVSGQRDGRIVGTVQLELSAKPNALHRAEVSKLMVHPDYQRQGIGRDLMLALEEEARRRNRTTLWLDTRQGEPSEALYTSLGWTVGGSMPAFTRNQHGGTDATVFYYKLIGSN